MVETSLDELGESLGARAEQRLTAGERYLTWLRGCHRWMYHDWLRHRTAGETS